MQYHETFLIRWVCSLEEHRALQETLHSLTWILQNKLIEMWEMLAELLQACSPDAEGTSIQKNGGKKNKNLQLLCLVFCNTPPPDHQQGLAWTSSSWVSFSHMTSKRANQLTRSKPNHESLCGTSHTTSTSSPQADWVTEQCSGNITKTLLNFCPSPFCPPLPYPFLTISTAVLCFPLLPSLHPSSHRLEPAERATQIQQLLWPSLA